MVRHDEPGSEEEHNKFREAEHRVAVRISGREVTSMWQGSGTPSKRGEKVENTV